MPSTLPVSNVAGNNQTSPGVGGITSRPSPPSVPGMGGQIGSIPSGNPFISVSPTSTPTATATSGGTIPGGGLYNPASHYSGGQTDINKQLIDMAGKGVGGSLDYFLKNISGNNSAIFQQYLASQVPANAMAEAQLRQSMGAMGVGGNSTPMAVGESNLAAQQAATAAGVNADLMKTGMADTMSILQNLTGPAIQQVASSGWNTLGKILGQLGGDAASLLGNMFKKGATPGGTSGGGLPGGAGSGATAGDMFGGDNSGLAGSNWTDTLPSDGSSLLNDPNPPLYDTGGTLDNLPEYPIDTGGASNGGWDGGGTYQDWSA